VASPSEEAALTDVVMSDSAVVTVVQGQATRYHPWNCLTRLNGPRKAGILGLAPTAGRDEDWPQLKHYEQTDHRWVLKTLSSWRYQWKFTVLPIELRAMLKLLSYQPLNWKDSSRVGGR